MTGFGLKKKKKDAHVFTLCFYVFDAKISTLMLAATLSMFAWSVDLCQAVRPPSRCDPAVNGETSQAESCCHSCLAWARRGSKSLVRLSNPPPPPIHIPSLHAIFKFFPPPASCSHSQKLHVAQSEGSGLGGGGECGLSARMFAGKKGKIDMKAGVSKYMEMWKNDFYSDKEPKRKTMYSWQERSEELV